MKQQRFTTAAAVLGALLCLAAAQSRAADPVRIKLATLAPRDSSFHKSLLAMGDKWKQASGGAVTLTVYPDGTQGGEADMVRRMRVGQLQAAMLTVPGLSQIEESVTGLQLMPMMFRSLDEFDHVLGKLRPALEKKFLDKGFVVLFWGDAGWVRFFSKHPALVPDDYRKMKVFVWSGDTRSIEIYKGLGFNAVPLEQTDILAGLQTGLVDVVTSIPFYALAGQFAGPAPHMLEVNWVPLVGGTVISKKTWDAVPASAKPAMLKVAAEAGEIMKQRGRTESDEAVEAMKKRGLKVRQTTPEALAAWQKLGEETYPRLRGKVVPADMFDEVQRLVKEFRAGAGKAQ
ncbi:MAG: C4-dicarboxylate ABC transporter substrate-binding protein [Verrucomicrobia bacterium]|nr:C4-dicarboxylate ABC transporter substrate-binding protein [Verrucomicrobiota bacterium]